MTSIKKTEEWRINMVQHIINRQPPLGVMEFKCPLRNHLSTKEAIRVQWPEPHAVMASIHTEKNRVFSIAIFFIGVHSWNYHGSKSYNKGYSNFDCKTRFLTWNDRCIPKRDPVLSVDSNHDSIILTTSTDGQYRIESLSVVVLSVEENHDLPQTCMSMNDVGTEFWDDEIVTTIRNILLSVEFDIRTKKRLAQS